MVRVYICLAILTLVVTLVSLLCAHDCVAKATVGACGILTVATFGSIAAPGASLRIWQTAWLALTLLLGGVALAEAAPLFSERAVQTVRGGAAR